MRHRRWLDARLGAVGGAVAVGVALARARYLRWGATDKELKVGLPGDELVGAADLTATRAVTIRAGADVVWPWIAQLGQGRGGFYSYDFLENLVGCDIQCTPQDFRHSYVTNLAAAGIDVADLADITGHTVETQHRRYRHALGRSFDRVRDAIG